VSAGYADEGGLANFDEDAAIQNLASVGAGLPRPEVDAVSGGAPTAPDVAAPAPAPELMAPDLGQEAPGIPAPPAPAAPPPTAPAANPQTAAFDIALPEIPQRPQLTGNHEQDVQLMSDWQEKLADYHQKLTSASTQVQQRQQGVLSDQAKKQLQVETANLAARKAEEAKAEAQSRRWQSAIDHAVQEKMRARKDLESGPDKLHGGQIVAAIFGAIGASLQNMAAIQAGHAGNYENQALNVINAKMKQKYEQRKERLAAAGDELLEARYGAKDANEAHRLALNDLDADQSAQYRLIAREAEARLRQLGIPEAQIKTNEVVVNALQKAAAAEGQIHERQASRENQRQASAATLALAKANLGERRSEYRGTLDERQREFDLRRKEAEDKAKEKADAAKEKADAALEARAIRDPETDEIIRYAPTPRGVEKVVDKQTAARAYSQGLRELADDIEKNGRVGSDLPIIGTEAGKRRKELHANVVARGRKALDLGVSNANMQLEHSAIGGSGAGLDRIASPEVLRKIADDNDKFAAQRLRGGTAPAKKAPAREAPAPATGKPSTDQVNAAYRILDRKDVSPKDRQTAVDILTAAGVL
jgi:hypothetical protein